MKRFGATSACPLAVAAVLLIPASVFAQRTTGDITGNVSDEQGAPVPGATITAACTTTGFTRTTTTDAQGGYRLPELPICVYKVSASLTNFKTTTREAKPAVDAASSEFEKGQKELAELKKTSRERILAAMKEFN